MPIISANRHIIAYIPDECGRVPTSKDPMWYQRWDDLKTLTGMIKRARAIFGTRFEIREIHYKGTKREHTTLIYSI